MSKNRLCFIRSQRGLYLVWLSFLIGALLLLGTLILGGGFMVYSAARVQNIANIVSLAAAKGYLDAVIDKNKIDPDHQRQSDQALLRANEILQANKNKVFGFSSNSSISLALSPTSGEVGKIGELQLGRYYLTAPGATCSDDDPCNCQYPCFLKYKGPTDPYANEVNAARVKMDLSGNNSLNLSLLSFTGSPIQFAPKAESVSYIQERCAVFLVNVANTMTTFSHETSSRCRTNRGSFGYWRDQVNPANGAECNGCSIHTPSGDECQSPDLSKGPCCRFNVCPIDNPSSCTTEQVYTDSCCEYVTCGNNQNDLTAWCNLGTEKRPASNPKYKHYQGDYQEFDTKDGPILVDTFTTPEPLTGTFKAVNAGLRVMQSQRNPADRVGIIIYAGQILDSVPSLTSPAKLLSSAEIGRLVDLTNVKNAGLAGGTSTIYPNIIDRRWFPMSDRQNSGVWQYNNFSNPEVAFDEAISRLSDPNQCPASAKKQIILVTGRRISCATKRYDPNNNAFWDQYFGGWGGETTLCGSSRVPWAFSGYDYPMIPSYLGVERQFFGFSGSNQIPDDPQNFDRTILSKLVSNKINVSVLLSDKDDLDTFINIKNPLTGKFHDYRSAAAAGYGGGIDIGLNYGTPETFISPENSFAYDMDTYNKYGVKYKKEYLCTENDRTPSAWSEKEDNWAYPCEGRGDDQSGYFGFVRPVRLYYQLVAATGGVWCPLLPTAVDNVGVRYDGTASTCVADAYDTTTKLFKDEKRKENENQRCGLKNITRSQQAAECISEALNSNPFSLVRAKKVVE